MMSFIRNSMVTWKRIITLGSWESLFWACFELRLDDQTLTPNMLHQKWAFHKFGSEGEQKGRFEATKKPPTGTLKLTFLPLEMDGWETTFLLDKPFFRGELLVSGSVPHQHFNYSIAEQQKQHLRPNRCCACPRIIGVLRWVGDSANLP